MSANQITVDQSLFFVVHSTNTSEGAATEVQISANLRETKDSKVTDAQRYRNIWIPEYSLPSVEDKFRPVLLSKLYDLAKQRFELDMEESSRLATKVPASNYTLAGLLEFFASQSVSGRITKESAEAWYKESAVRAYILGKKDEATAAKYGLYYTKLASPNHGTNPKDATSLLAMIQPADLETTIGAAFATRLQQTIDKANTSQVEAL